MLPQTKPLILIVEDSATIRALLEDYLTTEGYQVAMAATAEKLGEQLHKISPDIILLDIILPDGDGLSLIKKIRDHTDVPVIVVSGKSDMIDKVVGLEMGADDYISKPLEMRELSARVKAQLRRYQALKNPSENSSGSQASQKPNKIKFGDWVMDRERFQVFDRNSVSANLTPKEFMLLDVLVSASGRVLSRDQLLNQSRDGNYNTTDRAIDVQILRIRKKLNDTSEEGQLIQAVRGIGYAFAGKTESVL